MNTNGDEPKKPIVDSVYKLLIDDENVDIPISVSSEVLSKFRSIQFMLDDLSSDKDTPAIPLTMDGI